MLSLVYVSRNCIAPSSLRETLEDIQTVSIARNTRLDVTGLLIATPAYFCQLLEGPEGAIDEVMASILRDPRHSEVRVVRRTMVDRRQCPSWRMARYEGEAFAKFRIEPVLEAAHEVADARALQQLAQLLGAIAGDPNHPQGLIVDPCHGN